MGNDGALADSRKTTHEPQVAKSLSGSLDLPEFEQRFARKDFRSMTTGGSSIPAA